MRTTLVFSFPHFLARKAVIPVQVRKGERCQEPYTPLFALLYFLCFPGVFARPSGGRYATGYRPPCETYVTHISRKKWWVSLGLL